MECSICIATFDKAFWLSQSLNSIERQSPPFDFEVIVIDDGSDDNGATAEACLGIGGVNMRYKRIYRKPVYHNPSKARNLAYRLARGRVVICQSDDVVHMADNTIERLVTELEPATFLIATVYNTNLEHNITPLEDFPNITQLTGPELRRPFFFLGSLLRSDLYRAGGCDERYTGPGRDEQAFADSLTYGLGLKPRYVDVVGHHIDHPRPPDLQQLSKPSREFYHHRVRACRRGEESWLSPGAPWEYEACPAPV